MKSTPQAFVRLHPSSLNKVSFYAGDLDQSFCLTRCLRAFLLSKVCGLKSDLDQNEGKKKEDDLKSIDFPVILWEVPSGIEPL